MQSPLHDWPLIVMDSVDSTQRVAAEMLKAGEPVGGVMALEQTAGKGRFDRQWSSPQGECLAVSLVFTNYIGHPRPYLIGMALALASARAFKAEVQWPNDVTIRGRKLGGILTEMVADKDGRTVPIVGVGLNLLQFEFPPEIAETATSVILAHGQEVEPDEALARVMQQFETLREVETWHDLANWWARYDTTPGKKYRLQDGREALAKRIGDEGELICVVDGEVQTVLAADALLGAS